MPFNHLFHRILKPQVVLENPLLNPPRGVFHYPQENIQERFRLHLRIDPDGHGTLIINANRIVHLNPTATLMAYLVLEDFNESDAIRLLTNHYQASKKQIREDYVDFRNQMGEIIHTDNCYVCSFDNLEVSAPFSTRPTAPYRMDLALTYRCNDDCAHCYNARPRDYPELTTKEWTLILDRLWELGIPHVVFTGGEPTLRDDLPDLIEHAEKNGQITGLNTNGRRLSNKEFIGSLVEAGLDHIQITVESHIQEIHDLMVRKQGAWKQTIKGLTNALETPLFVMTNTTMLRENNSYLEDTLDHLAQLGVPTIGLNALIYAGKGATIASGLNEKELKPLLKIAIKRTKGNGQRLIWYSPTQYCNFDPTQLDLGVKGCSAALYNMCIEADGSVIPCQSYYYTLGNIIDDPWDSIWNHKLSLSLRERHNIPKKCSDCLILSECGGGCPLSYDQQFNELNINL